MRHLLLLMSLYTLTFFAVEMSFFPQEYVQECVQNDACELAEEMKLLKKESFMVVSLGENCFPALHLREYDIRIRSFPFDWDITPFTALYAILENDFDGFIDLKYLAINQKEFTVFNTKYQCKLNHDFDIKDWFDGPEGLAPRCEDSMKKYQKVLAYYHRRIARFYAIFDLDIPIYLFRRIISADQARRLDILLKSKFPRSNFTLVCIQDEGWDSSTLWKDMPSTIVHYRFPHPISHTLGQKNGFIEVILKDLGLIKN